MTRSEAKKAEVPQSPEEYAKLHQRSFRVAFDFLTSHFPPGQDPDWWLQAAKDVSAASITAGENVLVIELLTGVYKYLEYEYRVRRCQNGQAES